MSDNANHFDERMFSIAAVLAGGVLLIGAAFAGGPLSLTGAALAVICGTLIGEAAYTALWPDRSLTGTPTSRQPERDRAGPTDEPESAALCIPPDFTPAPGRSWRERETPAARPDTVERGR